MSKENCISCGRDDRPLQAIDGAFIPDRYRVCSECASKFTGVKHESDRLLTQKAPGAFCHKCGAAVLVLPTGHQFYCTPCLGEIYQQYRQALGR